MNKAHRHEIKMRKFKKRLLLRKMVIGETGHLGQPVNYHPFKNHSCPCSCIMCSGDKYNRAKSKVELLKHLGYY